jgi:hypothetical protein
MGSKAPFPHPFHDGSAVVESVGIVLGYGLAAVVGPSVECPSSSSASVKDSEVSQPRPFEMV